MYIDTLSLWCQYKSSWQSKKVYRITNVLFSYISFSMVRKNSGFTMVELMIVIAIIGILAVTLIPAFSGMQNRAKDSGTASAVNSAGIALEAYQSDTGTWFAPATGFALNNAAVSTFASLKKDSACAPQSSSIGSTITVTAGWCPGTSQSFGYVPAQNVSASDSYIIWAKMFTPARGTLISAPATWGTSTGGIVNMNGNQQFGTPSAGYYAIHGANRQ